MTPTCSALHLTTRARAVFTRAAAVLIAATILAGEARAQSWGLLGGHTSTNYWTSYNCSAGGGGIDQMNICGSGPHFGNTGTPLGIFFQRRINSVVTFEPELLYFPKGGGDGARPVLELSYLEVPLLARFAPGKTDSSFTRPFVFAGPAVGYLLRCNVDRAGTGSASCSAPANSDEHRKPLELSGVVGIGVEHRFAESWTLGFELRYGHSLMSVGYGDGDTRNHATTWLVRFTP